MVSLKGKIGEQKIDVVISRDKNRFIEQEAIKKGIELNIKKLKIKKILDECQKHIIRMEKYYKKVKDYLPLCASRYKRLEDEQIEAIDGYLFRFSKLQDSIGQKLFKDIVSEYKGKYDNVKIISVVLLLCV